ncbi:Potassium voltage-gated channel protein Shaker [Diplonema papillatum]|nr:Potassium voltage-gated channel protein Shaker [Diplonema papillatum]|eukprot:gene19072-29354_t
MVSVAAVMLSAEDNRAMHEASEMDDMGGHSVMVDRPLKQSRKGSIVSPPEGAWEDDECDLTFPLELSQKIMETMTNSQKIHAILDAHGFQEEHYAEKNRKLCNVTLLASFSLIIMSVTTFTIESLPDYYKRDLYIFYVLESICIGWFTMELLVRCITCPRFSGFLKSPMNWIDLIAILPYYLDMLIIISGSTSGSNANVLVVLRVIRLTRAFRVFKLSKYNEGMQVVGMAVLRSTDALSLLIFLTTIATVLFGSTMFYAEQAAADFDADMKKWVRKEEYGGPDAVHTFKSIPHAFWWCLVTVTTVGYGDMVPVTPPGYIVGCGAMVAGLLLLAFPIIILGANFTEARVEYFKQKERDIRAKREQRRYLIDQLQHVTVSEEARKILAEAPLTRFQATEEIEEVTTSSLLAELTRKIDALEALFDDLSDEGDDGGKRCGYPEPIVIISSPRPTEDRALSDSRRSPELAQDHG